jgi:hypothetical protein
MKIPAPRSEDTVEFHASAIFTGEHITAVHLADFISSVPSHADLEITTGAFYSEGEALQKETAIRATWNAKK